MTVLLQYTWVVVNNLSPLVCSMCALDTLLLERRVEEGRQCHINTVFICSHYIK